ncbi:MAG: energy transducer TonB [Gammaproteobacteria bacterium]|nr:energy transducer TonB [Gammaproteobacteria bacterium]MBI5616542.1 energy transducer TonB [Gammaproteobacteria bacterium]
MTTAALGRPIQPSDRLGLTLCVAIIVHAMIVLGVSFAPEKKRPARYESLDVTLVNQKSDTAPEKADLLAQANLKGGGDSETAERPSTPTEAPIPAPVAAVAAAAAPPQPAEAPAETPAPPVAAPPAPPAPKPKKEKAAPPKEAKLVQPAQIAELPKPTPAPTAETAPAEAAGGTPEVQAHAAIDSPPLPTAEQLITRSFALASLNSELQQRLETRAKRPRQKFISASTQEYQYAAYMEAWRAKVERIGNLNYPDEARQRKLSGSLLLDVALRPDGTVIEIVVRKSSGHKVLDDAAVRIVELAAPFAQFPDDIRKQVDVLHVTRTWKFLASEQFTAHD